MAYVTIRLDFAVTERDGYSYYTPQAATRVDTDIPDEDTEALVGEILESDRYFAATINGFFDSIRTTVPCAIYPEF